ncbi:PREDICTED: 1-acyl-sn-glycerol-3-phosphate acyltransferase 3 isoform X2 [Populus euphratica]|uniref:1-acylglycerol-3-phosphate O-acyltransferase n=1 Tax=Populus euphratica TaxID=75702 RepID=A0AAJ6X584_POPEU|nr:PREDICTED: 1-acyl-sn-glycerol-3-phosphate acyltransferase 3 isoform X2 [Populus euphratica]
MAWPAVLVIVPVGIIFILSGLIVNLIQAVLFILVRPLSKSLHRRINKIVAELLWLELIVLVDWWANLKIEVYADDETFELLGKEHALVISNHKSDLDWLVGWILAQRSGCLGSALAVMKKEAKVLPVIGWSMWFSDYVFLERSWGKDERTLQSGFEWLEDFPMPFWLALFVEGTRFTQAKLLAAQEFAASRGSPVPRNVLIPRTKGFVSAVTHLRSFVPAIYDATVAVANCQPAPTFLTIFRGQSSVIKVLLERHSMQELPETADGIAQWCKDAFVTKDAVLEKYFAKDIFSDKKLQDIGRPKKSLFVMIFWSSLLAYATVRLFQWLSLFLASWEVVAFSIAFLFLVTIIMQILIQSSESERSTPAANFTLSEGTRQRLLPR